MGRHFRLYEKKAAHKPQAPRLCYGQKRGSDSCADLGEGSGEEQRLALAGARHVLALHDAADLQPAAQILGIHSRFSPQFQVATLPPPPLLLRTLAVGATQFKLSIGRGLAAAALL